MDVRNIAGRGNKLICALLVYFGIIFGLSDANAAVLRCDNCNSTTRTNLAKTAGAGTHLVADFSQEVLYGYRVEYDRERRVFMVFSAMVPQGIRNSFAFVLSPEMENSGGVVIIGPGRPGNPFPFPAGFNNANAYDIVRSSTYRAMLEQQMAAGFSWATTGNTAWDDAAYSLTSLALNVIGVDVSTVIIIWSDGSKTVLTIDSDSTYRAKYEMGESRDSIGNMIPDASINNPATGGRFAGSYIFNNSNDLQDWVDTAILYGVSVTGSGTGGMSCTWDGKTLTCRLSKK